MASPPVDRGLARFTNRGLPFVLLVTLLVLALGFAHKSQCVRPDFNERGYRLLCYSDILPLYHSEGLDRSRVPYLQTPNEYPVVTGLFMWAMSLVGRSQRGFFLANAVALAGFGLLTSVLLYRSVGRRVWFFALAPALFLYGFLNWDLLVVFLATAATIAFLARRDGLSGVLLGVGAAAKLYPALFLVPFVLQRLHEDDRKGAVRLGLAAVGTWVLVDLPFAVLSPERWSFFFRYSSSRPMTYGTLWFAGCDAIADREHCLSIPVLNGVSALLTLVLAAWLWRMKTSRDQGFARWTFAFPLLIVFLLVNKVYSPQYSLWLIPWFALVLPDLRLFVAFAVADLAVFVTEFSWLGRHFGYAGLPVWPVEIAALARAAVLVWILFVYVHGVIREGRPIAIASRDDARIP